MLRLDAEFIRRAVCVVVPFLWLLVHGLCLAFGEVTCIQVNPNQWICSGEGNGGEYPPIVVTNVVGVCTNCTAMSPETCQMMKDELLGFADEVGSTLSNLDQKIWDVKNQIYALILEGDEFTPNRHYNGKDEVLDADPSQLAYLKKFSGNYTGDPTAPGNSWYDLATGANSIANYYYTAVQPVLDSSYSILADMQNNHIYPLNSSLMSLIPGFNSIDCSACTASFDGSPTNSIPGGGSGGGGSSSCTNCVCKEQLEAILKVLKGKTTIVEDETREVESIASTVDRIKTSFNAFRMYMKDIFEGHTHISITDGNWTNVYLTGHASGFDYNKSNVLERIELLLWSLTSLNTPSNTTSYLDGKGINDVGDAIDEGLDSLKSDISYATNNIAGFHSSLVGLVSALQPIGSSDGGFSHTFLGHTEFNLGDTHFDVPDLVADYDNLRDAQGFFDVLRLSFQVLYLAGSAYCIWVFWAFALNKTLVFVKWAGEIMTAFFG